MLKHSALRLPPEGSVRIYDAAFQERQAAIAAYRATLHNSMPSHIADSICDAAILAVIGDLTLEQFYS